MSAAPVPEGGGHIVDMHDKAVILMESLPWIKRAWGRTVVIKYGGAAMSDEAMKHSVAADIVLMKLVGINPVIVHGGGPEITGYMNRLGMPVEFVDGLRVTSDEAMELVRMVLVGKVNGDIVSAINAHGRLAVGIAGDDGNLIRASAIDERLGRVGQIDRIDTTVVANLIEDGFIPVIASVGGGDDGGSFNINADLVAGEIASALGAEKVIFLTDVDGLYADFADKGSLISALTLEEADRRSLEALERALATTVEGFVQHPDDALGDADVQRTIDEISALKPALVAPTHCTGFSAAAHFAARMPDAFVQCVVGTTFVF